MSVNTINRKEGDFAVLDAIKRLNIYAIETCGKEDCFPKRDRWIMPKRILDEIIGALLCISKANSIYPSAPNEAFDWTERHKYQIEAQEHLDAVEQLIDLTKQISSYKINAEYWTKLIFDASKKLKGWMRYDKERQKDALKTTE